MSTASSSTASSIFKWGLFGRSLLTLKVAASDPTLSPGASSSGHKRSRAGGCLCVAPCKANQQTDTHCDKSQFTATMLGASSLGGVGPSFDPYSPGSGSRSPSRDFRVLALSPRYVAPRLTPAVRLGNHPALAGIAQRKSSSQVSCRRGFNSLTRLHRLLGMPQNAFRRGFVDGRSSIRGSEAAPTVPAYSAEPGKDPYRAGVARGV